MRIHCKPKGLIVQPPSILPLEPQEYCILGDPLPLRRARITSITPKQSLQLQSRRRMFDSQIKEKYAIGLQLRNQHGILPFFDGPIAISIHFYMPRTNKLKNQTDYFHAKKPDLDNLIKMVLDCATGILYEDDSTVAQITARKIYDLNARTVFTISQL